MASRTEEVHETKYVNYFTGLVLTDKHLSLAHQYHDEKRQQQNRLFHGCGVVPGILNEMRVTAHKSGDNLALEVGSGLCLDAAGREIVFSENKILGLDIKKFKLPRRVYVVIAHQKSLEDHFVNPANPAYQGYQTVRETFKLEISGQEPDPLQGVELARIDLEEPKDHGALAVRDAKDFGNPQANEIDLRFVPWCRAAVSALSPDLMSQLAYVLERTRDTASLVETEVPVQALRELQWMSAANLVILSGGSMNFSNLVHLIGPMVRLDQKIAREVQDLEKNSPKQHYTVMKAFGDYKNLAAELMQTLDRQHGSVEDFYLLLNGHARAMEFLKNLLKVDRMTWEDLKLFSRELPKVLLINDTKYTLVDTLEMGTKENLDAHLFKTEQVKDSLLSKQSFSYPDNQTVDDVVMSYRLGTWTWKVRNCLPNKPLILVRRFDYFHGQLELDILVHGKSAGNLTVQGRDTRHRWRNWVFTIDAEHITSDTVEISQRWLKGQQDGVARMWFYQPL